MSGDAPVVDAVYQGSDGNWYTRWEVDQKLLAGVWDLCLEEADGGRRLVRPDESDDLVMLVPVDVETLPPWLEVRSDGRRARVVDTRRGIS